MLHTRQRLGAFILVLGCVFCVGGTRGWAQSTPHEQMPAVIHVVDKTDTLAAIARLYYGDVRLERVIVAENGLLGRGATPIASGMRLLIPLVYYYRVREGDTWASIANRYYGSPSRAFVIAAANSKLSSNANRPAVDAEVIVPYPVKHVVSANEAISQVAAWYTSDKNMTATVKRFNGITSNKVKRGGVLLIPLSNLVLSTEGKRLLSIKADEPEEPARVHQKQERALDELARLEHALVAARYLEAHAIANRLLGTTTLTLEQHQQVLIALAQIYVAFERSDLASDILRQLRKLSPAYTFDVKRMSPKVLDLWNKIQAN